MLNYLLPVTTTQVILVDSVGGNDANTGAISALPIVLANDAEATIAAGIGSAADGSTVIVFPGAYPVSITANKSINLIGMHRKGCLVTATGFAGPACSLSDYGATIENFTITSAASSSAEAGTLSLASSCTIARHLDIVLTANASLTVYGIVCVSTAIKTRLEDIYLTSDASGMLIDGSDFIGKDLTILCTNAQSGVPIGVKNQGVRARLIDSSIYVINNQDNAAAGVIGFENDTTNGSDTCILSGCFINAVNEHANGAAACYGIIAETPMILRDCDINVRNDGAGATYGLKADDDVLLASALALEAWAATLSETAMSEKIGDYSYSKKQADNKLALAQRYRDASGSGPVTTWGEMDLAAVGEFPEDE